MKKLNLTEGVVHTTTNYNAFAFISVNRDVKKLSNAYKTIKKKLTHEGQLQPILINDSCEVIDGQHRLTALSELKLPVDYIVKRGIGKKEVVSCNDDPNSWKTQNYIDMYKKEGKRSYAILDSTMKTHKLSANSTHAAIKGREIQQALFRAGQLSITDADQKIFKKYEDQFVEIVNINGRRLYKPLIRSRVISTLFKLLKHPMYNHKNFMKKLNQEESYPSVNTNYNAEKMLLQTYNRSLSKAKQIKEL